MITRMPEILAKLARLRPSDWRDLAQAQMALIKAQMSVWRRARGELVNPSADLDPSAGAAKQPAGGARLEPGAARLVLALDRAARHGVVRPRCLVRAMALAQLMQSRGYTDASVRVGVRRKGPRFIAHAWVEYQGLIVGEDDAHVATFIPMPEVQVRL